MSPECHSIYEYVVSCLAHNTALIKHKNQRALSKTIVMEIHLGNDQA